MNDTVKGPGQPAELPPSAMCQACSDAYMAWLDYTLPPPPIRLDGTSIRTARDIRDYQERRYREWRDTVRFQQELIRSLYPGPGHTADTGSLPCPAADPLS